MASSWRRLSRHPVDQPSVSMIVEWALLWVYRVSHCPTFSVNSLWIIGVCYRGILVSVGQSHDISLWSILSLGNYCLINDDINQRCVYASLGFRMLTHGGQDKMAAIFLTTQIAKFMGPTWVMSAPDGPHVGPMNFVIRGHFQIFLNENVWFHWNLFLRVQLAIFLHRFR